MWPSKRWLTAMGLIALALAIAGCGGAPAAAPSSPAPGVEATLVVKETTAVAGRPTEAPPTGTAGAASEVTPPTADSTTAPSPSQVPPTPVVENRYIEVEWPPHMRLGDSDVVRVSLIPASAGYIVTTEFPDHITLTSTLTVTHPSGYSVFGVARLDAVNFTLSPNAEQEIALPVNQPITWRWTITPQRTGVHRLAVVVSLRWKTAPNAATVLETQLYSKSVEVQVQTWLGLNTTQAGGVGLLGFVLGSVLSLPLAAHYWRTRALGALRPRALVLRPNARLVIEQHPAFALNLEEQTVLRVLFRAYARLVVQAEFRSGYSGARTVLVQPLHADGRADAPTIAKLGDTAAILSEYDNYERFVKDTLPPITARIQALPVTSASGLAALRYTFIGEPGQPPISLREALLANADPALLDKLFNTFGPMWWRQRRPYTFRVAQEYDRMLPAHVVLEPLPLNTPAPHILDGRQMPSAFNLSIGDVVTVRHLNVVERRLPQHALALAGEAVPGHPPFRARWLSLDPPTDRRPARIVATRESLLRERVASLDRYGLPDPLAALNAYLAESLAGTQATIHGDLNLENVLLGPGGLIWLIDFAQTRDGHTLYDFAHLSADVIAHVLAPQVTSIPIFLATLDANADPLLRALRAMAMQCVFNPALPREYDLAFYLACLGALKFDNLTPHQRHLLYLTAAYISRTL